VPSVATAHGKLKFTRDINKIFTSEFRVVLFGTRCMQMTVDLELAVMVNDEQASNFAVLNSDSQSLLYYPGR
jgi:hypothetical protein